MVACGVVEVFVDGDWLDISDYVDLAQMPLESWHGRQTILEEPSASSLRLRLRNHDRRFSPGNTAVYGDFDEGTPIRWSEVVSATTVWNFRGFIEGVADETTTDEDVVHQWAYVSGVDLVTFLDRAKRFTSTLSAHIMSYRHTGSGTLYGYWPLTDTAAPFRPLVGSAQATVSISQGALRPVETHAAVLPAEGSAPIGDPVPGVYLQMGMNDTASADSPIITVGSGGLGHGIVPPEAGPLMDWPPMVVLWLDLEEPVDETITIFTLLGDNTPGVGGAYTITLKRLASGSGQVLQLASTGAISATLTSTIVGSTERFAIIAAGLDYSTGPGLLALWVDDQAETVSVGGSVSNHEITRVTIGGQLQGTVRDLQLYFGITSAEFLAQRDVGLYGLARQTVTERIETILSYAGIDSGDTDIGTSGTTMQRADLAGKLPGTAIRAAAETDQGLWFGAPDGSATFQSRRLRYYDPDASPVEIPYEWLATPLQQRRNPRINVAQVTQTGGVGGYAEDADSVAQFGERVFDATLETSCDADPQVLASFIINQYATPRTRLLSLRFQLDGLAEADRLTLLSLVIGDRIEITDAPAGWPTGVVHMSVEGRARSAGDENELVLTGSPVLGAAGGSGEAWFRLGTSELGGDDVMPF